jgi:hypothetical protein
MEPVYLGRKIRRCSREVLVRRSNKLGRNVLGEERFRIIRAEGDTRRAEGIERAKQIPARSSRWLGTAAELR